MLWLLIIVVTLAGCGQASLHPSVNPSESLIPMTPAQPVSSGPFPEQNLLSREKSPYLLQHADNPVHWYPWGEQAFAKAAAQDKPVFLSIGYSTCHWCHVMEHESFEDKTIADILNQYFVAIKVDREERPDIDGVYMKAVTSIAGQGGWPLSAFLTPDRKPFYGGTYFPPESRWGMPGFKDILLSIHQAWVKQRKDVLKSGESIVAHLQERPQSGGDAEPGQDILEKAYGQFAARFDSTYGGFGSAPKFPSAHNLSFLLRYWKRTGEARALGMARKTLDAMAAGGMYDQIGGGFHRYSTDERWHVPHFEKMLYDQATLATAYLEAYQATREPDYARVAREVLDYVLRDMTDASGGFYSAEDADSLFVSRLDAAQQGQAGLSPETAHEGEKREGAFYVWTHKEIEFLLGSENAHIFNDYYGVRANGNAQTDPHGEFTGQNILYVADSLEDTARHFQKSPDQIIEILKDARRRLLETRSRHHRPHLDDKILTDWNGLMISAFASAARILEEPRYQNAAEKAAQFILKSLVRSSDGRLLHRFRDGEAAVLGTIEDYAFFIHGLIDLYETTFNAEYLKEAKRLTQDMVTLFWDKSVGGFFFTATDAEKLLVRQKEIYDGAIPSGNSMAALDFLRMGRLTANSEWEKKADQLFKTFGSDLAAAPSAYSQMLCALDFALGPSKEIVIAGDPAAPQTIAMLKIINDRFIPNKVVLLRPSSDEKAKMIISLAPFVANQKPINNQPAAYVCQNYHCEFPVADIKRLEELLK